MSGAGGPTADAWDCHAHVIGPPDRWPLSPDRRYDPPFASLEAYLTVLDSLDLERGVLVQPSVYGFDNACLLDALERADGRLEGIAVPAPGTAPSELERLHRLGVRGVRCNVLDPGGLPPAAVRAWSPALRDLGWRVELQVDVEEVDDPETWLGGFGVPVVIDHMGRPRPGRTDPAGPALRRLVELLGEGRCFVKLSAPYRLSERGPPWSDVAPLARALLRAKPRACLWGTDWPHTDTAAPVDDDELRGALHDWCVGAGVPPRTVLVEAPAALRAG